MVSSVSVGFDHAGADLSHKLMEYLRNQGYLVACPQNSRSFDEKSIPYPAVIPLVIKEVLSQGVWGLLVCGSGIGMSIGANRYVGIRAALCRNTIDAILARQHNDANVLVLGARTGDFSLNPELAIQCLCAFLTADFAQGRHRERVKMLDDISSTRVPYA